MRRSGVFVVVLVLGLLGPGVAEAADDDRTCRPGDRGRLLRFERVASHPTAADARAYIYQWAVARHRYLHAATEASSAADLLVASRDVLAAGSCSPSGSPRAGTRPWPCTGCWSAGGSR